MGKVRCMGWFCENDTETGKHGLKRPKGPEINFFYPKSAEPDFFWPKMTLFDPKTGFPP